MLTYKQNQFYKHELELSRRLYVIYIFSIESDAIEIHSINHCKNITDDLK